MTRKWNTLTPPSLPTSSSPDDLSLLHKYIGWLYLCNSRSSRRAKSSITLKLFSILKKRKPVSKKNLVTYRMFHEKQLVENEKNDCWFVIPFKFTLICRAWRRLCKEDKIKARMPHKINLAIEIRTFNQWKTSFMEQIRSQWLQGSIPSPWMIAIYLFKTMTIIFCILIATLIRSFQTLSIF